MDIKTSKRRSRQNKADQIFKCFLGLALAFLVGGIASTALKYRWPLSTSFDFDEGLPGDSHILVLPSILHCILVGLLLMGIAVALRKYLLPIKKLMFFYVSASLFVLFFQAWTIYRLTLNSSPKLDWSLVQPQAYLDVPVRMEILKIYQRDPAGICALLENSTGAAKVSGIAPDGTSFRKIPSRDFVVQSLNGKIPDLCTDKGSFDTARILSEYYKSLAWFGKECIPENMSTSCKSVKENLLEFGSATKPAWKPTNFHKTEHGTFLEFAANAGDGVVFVQNLQVADNNIGITELANHAAEAGKAVTYKIYAFNCAEHSYGMLAKTFAVGDAHWKNRPFPVKEMPLIPISPPGTDVGSYAEIACK